MQTAVACFLLVSFLPVFVFSGECDGGVAVHLDGVFYVYRSSAWYDTTENSGSRRVELRGSYIADSTGIHTFYGWSDTYGDTSLYTSKSTLRLDDSLVNDATPGEWSIEHSCMQDFRYSFILGVTQDYMWVRCSLAVATPLKAKFDLSGMDYVQTCEISGCRNTDLSRDSYLCQPSPSPAETPESSATPSFTVAIWPQSRRFFAVAARFVVSLLLQSKS
jgi:hypothetical protein